MAKLQVDPTQTQNALDYHSATPYLVLNDAAAAIDFYRAAFGAVERSRRTDNAGRIRHAEVRIGDSTIMLAEEFDYFGVKARSPLTSGSTNMHTYLFVDDADQMVARAVAAGASVVDAVTDQDYGVRSGGVTDPWGQVWWIASPLRK